jgi:hypothetical protein
VSTPIRFFTMTSPLLLSWLVRECQQQCAASEP